MDTPNEEVIPLYANHITMCRFPEETNQEYLEVSRALKRLARKAHEKKEELSTPIMTAPTNRCM